jgi:hypothetical protein
MSSRQPEKEGIPKKKKNMRKRMSMVYHYSVLYMVIDAQYNVFLMGIRIFCTVL